jgi:hypothetical protein
MFRAIFAALARSLRVALGIATLPFAWAFGGRPPETADLVIARNEMAAAIDEERRAKEMEVRLADAEQRVIEEERLAAQRAALKAAATPRRAAQVVPFQPVVDEEPDQDAAPAPRT